VTRDEAIARARQHAALRGWHFPDPVRARRERTFIASGRLRWVVIANATGPGERPRVIIDERTERVEGARLVSVGLAPDPATPAPPESSPRATATQQPTSSKADASCGRSEA
jgi:hypothetical protein